MYIVESEVPQQVVLLESCWFHESYLGVHDTDLGGAKDVRHGVIVHRSRFIELRVEARYSGGMLLTRSFKAVHYLSLPSERTLYCSVAKLRVRTSFRGSL